METAQLEELSPGLLRSPFSRWLSPPSGAALSEAALAHDVTYYSEGDGPPPVHTVPRLIQLFESMANPAEDQG